MLSIGSISNTGGERRGGERRKEREGKGEERKEKFMLNTRKREERKEGRSRG